MDLLKIEKDVEQIILELVEAAGLKAQDALVIGGSTSEIMGEDLGSATNMEVARLVINKIVSLLKARDIYSVVQSCEHINRALVVEEDYAFKYNLELVNVVPIESAGGGFATAAMEVFEKPVVVEHVRVKAGIDIGDVLIGMHLRDVAVVVRSEIEKIGQAKLTMARTRLKLIGGDRSQHF